MDKYTEAVTAWAVSELKRKRKRDFAKLATDSITVFFAAHAGWDTFGEPAGLGATIRYRVILAKGVENRELYLEDLSMEDVLRKLFELA